ncbi:MAG: septum formation protein Maf [Deltaproteobacteria bacterium]|nr:septum formation protein Maf [Deltaproteobacteria bacterium]
MRAAPRLILASASPRRRELLGVIGVPFRVVPSRIEETPRPGEAPRRFVRRAAREKGEEVASRYPAAHVLSADTIVVAGGRILGKPGDRDEAMGMLSLLQGRWHFVHTAVCLLRQESGYTDELCETSRVRFRTLTREEIAGYLRTGESDDKAGAYAAQGAGNLLIDRIAGSFTNVVGLPMTQTLAMLQSAGLLAVSRRGPGWYRLAGGKR